MRSEHSVARHSGGCVRKGSDPIYSLQCPLEKQIVAERLSGFIAGGPDDIRIGPIMAIPDVLEELGVKPERAFAEADVDPALFSSPDNRMSLSAAGRLLRISAQLTGTDHFGLLVGDRFMLNSLGDLGTLMQNSATVGDALRSLLLHLHLHDRGAAPILFSPTPGYSVLGYVIYRHNTPAPSMIYDAAITIAYRILEELCDESWSPLCVQFSYSKPDDAASYRHFFNTRVRFDAEVSGVVFESKWLSNPIIDAKPNLHFDLVRLVLQQENRNALSFIEQVRIVLPQMVLSGTASSQAIAALFGFSERTLRRRLVEQSTNLQKLLDEARFELARQLLGNTSLTVSEIALSLHYSDPNVFSRAFRNWAGLSPTRWRKHNPTKL